VGHVRPGLLLHPGAASGVSLLEHSRPAIFNRGIAESKPCAPVRIIVAGGQAIFRDGLRSLLRKATEFQVIGEATDDESAIQLTRQQRPDILVLDHPLPRQSELDVLREISILAPAVRMLLLTDSLHEMDVLLVLRLGVRGVVLKNSVNTRLLYEAIRCVMAGGYWVGNESIAILVDAVRAISLNGETMSHGTFGLTAREIEIVSIVVQGYSNAEIADALMLSVQTVKNHLKNIFDKLGVYSRLELALFAVNHRLLSNCR
jgi:two-component system nitrate/nitrite response regulator NarL